MDVRCDNSKCKHNIELGLSDDYLQGFNARIKGEPYDELQTDDWKQGWKNANWHLTVME